MEKFEAGEERFEFVPFVLNDDGEEFGRVYHVLENGTVKQVIPSDAGMYECVRTAHWYCDQNGIDVDVVNRSIQTNKGEK